MLRAVENCGTGAGGFTEGNTCAKGGAHGRDLTSSPAFKKWFGDSKVVDADGKPLRVFHGTGSEVAFSEFKQGFKLELASLNRLLELTPQQNHAIEVSQKLIREQERKA